MYIYFLLCTKLYAKLFFTLDYSKSTFNIKIFMSSCSSNGIIRTLLKIFQGTYSTFISGHVIGILKVEMYWFSISTVDLKKVKILYLWYDHSTSVLYSMHISMQFCEMMFGATVLRKYGIACDVW